MGSPMLSSSLIYLCNQLSVLGLKHLSPRIFLLAASNHPAAKEPVLVALLHLTLLHLASCHLHSPADGQNDCCQASDMGGHPNGLLCNSLPPLKVKDGAHCQEENLSLVKFYLALWGYPSTSSFFAVSPNTMESRQLLLAFAWLISHCEIFSQTRVLKSVNGSVLNDLSKQKSALLASAKAKALAAVHKLLDASNSMADSRIRARSRAEQVLLLYGKVRISMRALSASLSCRAEQVHVLNHIQFSQGIRDPDQGRHFSQFELHLLESKDALERHIVSLNSAKQVLEESDWHENIFWQWMTVIALEDRKNPTLGVECRQFSGVCNEILSPVLHDFKEKLHMKMTSTNQYPPNSLKSAASVSHSSRTDLFQGSEGDEVRTEMQDLAIGSGHLPGPELPIASLREYLFHYTPASTSSGPLLDSTTLAYKLLESLKDIGDKLASTLATIRANNRMKAGDPQSDLIRIIAPLCSQGGSDSRGS